MLSMKEQLTVMILTDVLNKMGGAEGNVHSVSRGLKEKGYEVIICCLQGAEVAAEIRQRGFRVEVLDLKRIRSYPRRM